MTLHLPHHPAPTPPSPRGARLALTGAVLLAVLLPARPSVAQEGVPLTPGMVITESVRIRPGLYTIPGGSSLEEAVVVIRGQGIRVDLTGVELRGLEPEADPDLARGVAIRVEGGSDVTLRGGRIRGYRFGILARGTRALRILDADLSHGWKPRLFSQVGHESLVDWLSFHQNEEREWMRFGAAIYLEDVTGGEIRGNRAVQGMNGLLMTRTDSLRVRDNDFSYNSGLGAGLYRSSHNTLVRNFFDYDVRGYSEGFYQRGQDSAGILLYEQSSHNVVAYNSATHSGDGVFLWAGQSTMDTGKGGANDNLLFHNDFSRSPTNAVEVTFSRNRIVGNILRDSRYGVWGGYSWETEILGNCFGGNRYGVAIEHGQDNLIRHNRFDGDSLAISLWSRESEPEDWGYARERDTRSRGHLVADNVFAGNAEHWRLERTGGHLVGENPVLPEIPTEPCDPRILLGEAFDSLAPDLPGVPRTIPVAPRARLPRSAIVVDEWGPYDGRSPKLWPVDTATAQVRLRVLGPPGSWRATGTRGVARMGTTGGSVSVRGGQEDAGTPPVSETGEILEGVMGDTLVVIPVPGAEGDWAVELEYRGEETVSPRGTVREAGAPVPFRFERFEPTGEWEVRFFTWSDPAMDPDRDPEAFATVFREEPVLTRTEDRFDYQWYTPTVPGLPLERWAAEATTRVELEPGTYSIRTISDDGIRVWVDGELVLDAFDPHGSRVDYAPLEAGSHEIRVRYVQIGGWTEGRVDVIRGDARSRGSAGPH